MDLQLQGKTALITGSTAGIGYAIAAQLAREGARIIVNGRSRQRVDEAVAKLKSIATAGVEGIAADFSKAADVQAITERFPQVDILVNNVGIFEPKPFETIPDEDWFRFFEVNVLSGVRLSRHYLPVMLKAGWGRIIFISSESSIYIPAEMVHYGMTKTAQLAISSGLASLTKGTAVTVNAVLPGPTRSEGVGDFLGTLSAQQGVSAADAEKWFFTHARPSSLLQRFAGVEEIANLVTYVASPLSSATNGAALRADGGIVRSII